MGVPARTVEQIDSAVEGRLWNEWSVPVLPVLVIPLSSGFIPVQVPADASAVRVVARVGWGGGVTDTGEWDAAEIEKAGSAQIRGRGFTRGRVSLPPRAPPGSP